MSLSINYNNEVPNLPPPDVAKEGSISKIMGNKVKARFEEYNSTTTNNNEVCID